MIEQPAGRDVMRRVLDEATARALTVLLGLDAETAAEIRERTPSRRRRDPQHGPRLDLGGDPDGERDDVDVTNPSGA